MAPGGMEFNSFLARRCQCAGAIDWVNTFGGRAVFREWCDTLPYRGRPQGGGYSTVEDLQAILPAR